MTGSASDAGRYAEAFLAAAWDGWQTLLNSLSQSLAPGTDLRCRLQSAGRDEAALQAILQEQLPDGIPAPFLRLVTVMAADDRLDQLPAVAGELDELLHGGGARQVTAEITSAIQLSAERREQLTAQLRAEHGSELEVRFSVEPALMGGLRIRVGDQLTDLSVASSLQALRDDVMASV
jgi:F-type H+-transporting ATPase subunit delta